MQTQEVIHEEAVAKTTEWIMSYTSSKPVLMVSGGSAGRLFAEAWRAMPTNARTNFTLTLVDERYGAVGHKDSNWQLLQDLGALEGAADDSFPVLIDGLDFSETAQRWEHSLVIAQAARRPILAILGIGEDEHIAGIKPRSPSAIEKVSFVSHYTWTDYDRITISPVMFSRLHDAMIYLQGPAKKSIIDSLQSNSDPVTSPAQFAKIIPKCHIVFEP